MFWGLFFVVLGISIIFEHVFKINLPMFKIFIALFIIFIGIKILFGSFGSQFNFSTVINDKQAIFGSSTLKYENGNEYQIVFGQGFLDLSTIDVAHNHEVIINTVFGSVDLVVPEKFPIYAETNTVFGSSQFPNRDISAIGKFTYKSDNYKEELPSLRIRSNVVFGNLKIKNQN